MFFRSLIKKITQIHPVLIGMLVLLAPISESLAQAEWQRTVKLIAPIEEGMMTRALTDSVVAMAEAQDLRLQRTPESSTTTTLTNIESALSEEGLALTSATHVFITYRFTLNSSSLQRDILDLHFIYRPTAKQGEDIPVLYLDLSNEDLYRKLLVKKGTPSAANELASRPFEEQIAFHSLQDTATVVQVGKQIIRNPERAASKKQQIAGTIRELTYN